MSVNFLLSESATGYSLYEVVQAEEIGAQTKEVQEAAQDLSKFGRYVKLKSFAPFKNAAHALENANDVSEGLVHEHLKAFLEMNLPKAGKKSKPVLAVSDKNLAGSIMSALPGVECSAAELAQALLRGVRQHGPKLLKQLQAGDMERAQLGLGHSYSRSKVKFNVNRSDNMIIQAIALIDQLDKDINTFSMRVREWYSWHFPELVKLVNDNRSFAKLAMVIRDKNSLNDERLHEIASHVSDDETIAQSIIDAAKISMGQDISEADMENVITFAERVVKLADYRIRLHKYLVDKMAVVAPNLAELIGEIVGARLISHAGSLTNLSKYPASTIQILGAEKALFRALKTKGNTPKYGLIYHSSFIGRAGQKNKGRVSRFLANKVSIVSRIDNFTDVPSTKFGEVLKRQVEERLQFYETGETPTKNEVAMKEAMQSVLSDIKVAVPEVESSSSKKKASKSDKTEKSSKKDKKRKAEETGEKSSKKKKKSKD
ncbi:U3 snoRNP protein Nop56 [Protomyces lactucae-debilis]|uniref:Nucleolar protein 56 n=1 Tax=Protomyces lactucae-debilis TaxID=2754530 RepID=A0A1Y2F1T6_PROLT|nr:U3 snoRNP protein Nop56 [Protomyces lactucae-debilis]ORY77667.1 U3 snoRNP protein Nop56 [Protomyces lactucae-debilis]